MTRSQLRTIVRNVGICALSTVQVLGLAAAAPPHESPPTPTELPEQVVPVHEAQGDPLSITPPQGANSGHPLHGKLTYTFGTYDADRLITVYLAVREVALHHMKARTLSVVFYPTFGEVLTISPDGHSILILRGDPDPVYTEYNPHILEYLRNSIWK